MSFTSKPHFIILLLTISSSLLIFVSALNSPAEAPGSDGILPLAEKHVVIRNVVEDGYGLNCHCKSTENDLGLIRIPFNGQWDFRFHVNMSKTTKFRCHFTWTGGGSHCFDIFKVSRDDTPSGRTPVCKECIWEIGRDDREQQVCRINRDGSTPYCFQWEACP